MEKKSKTLSVNRAREHAINAYTQCKAEDDRKKAVFELYDALCQSQPYANLMQASDMSADEMYTIVEHMRNSGWAQAFYMPIASFAYVRSLKYSLAHKQELLGNKGHEAFGDAVLRLRRFFVTPLG